MMMYTFQRKKKLLRSGVRDLFVMVEKILFNFFFHLCWAGLSGALMCTVRKGNIGGRSISLPFAYLWFGWWCSQPWKVQEQQAGSRQTPHSQTHGKETRWIKGCCKLHLECSTWENQHGSAFLRAVCLVFLTNMGSITTRIHGLWQIITSCHFQCYILRIFWIESSSSQIYLSKRMTITAHPC